MSSIYTINRSNFFHGKNITYNLEFELKIGYTRPMTNVDHYSGFGKTDAVTAALNALCKHALSSSRPGLHVACTSEDEAKRVSMEPFPSYCVLHALKAKQEAGDSTTFICPSGLEAETILEIGRRSEPSYKLAKN